MELCFQPLRCFKKSKQYPLMDLLNSITVYKISFQNTINNVFY